MTVRRLMYFNDHPFLVHNWNDDMFLVTDMLTGVTGWESISTLFWWRGVGNRWQDFTVRFTHV